jgi:hypothetical protein
MMTKKEIREIINKISEIESVLNAEGLDTWRKWKQLTPDELNNKNVGEQMFELSHRFFAAQNSVKTARSTLESIIK